MNGNDRQLIGFKTSAWQSAGMVAGYAERMHENRGTNQLKNFVEVSLCREHVTGKRIIDVGIGTGRGSLPLALDGYDVTGIDISNEMLAQCKREAGDTPIELLAGDLTKLPVADESFDSLISLNVVVHFPNWREALSDWTRVVKPGGRLVFDVHSLDHLHAVAAAAGCAPMDLLTPAQSNDPSQYMLRVTAREIAEAAQACGLTVERLVPYAAILGGGNVNYWLRDSLLWGMLGDRALSWMAQDPALFDFGAFIEQTVMHNLSTHATGRMMVVLSKREDFAQTERVLVHNDNLAAAFASGGVKGLRESLGDAVTQWDEQLRVHLANARNRALLSMALAGPLAKPLRSFFAELAGEDLAAELFNAAALREIDESVHDFVRTWHRALQNPSLLEYKGVALAPSLEYDLMREILIEEHFNAAEMAR